MLSSVSMYRLFALLKKIWVGCGKPFPRTIRFLRHNILGYWWPAVFVTIPAKSVGVLEYDIVPEYYSTETVCSATFLIDIIIPTFNNASYTLRCIESLKKHTKNYRIIWIDNGSSEEEHTIIKQVLETVPHITLRHPERLGYVKATNMGIAASTSPIIILLNNDTEVTHNWLTSLLKPMKDSPEIGLTGPVTDSTATWQGHAKPGDGYEVIHTVLAFFCVAIRREVILDIGYLSEEFGEGFADDDYYSSRATATGWKIALAKNAFVHHSLHRTFNLVHGTQKTSEMVRKAQYTYKKKLAYTYSA